MPISDYLLKQYPNCIFSLSGEDSSTLDWDQSNLLPKPTVEELEDNKDYVAPALTPEQIAVQEAAVAALQYKSLRAAEYPPITDYLDGVVKGDQAQIDAYIAACQAVKAKYPKPA
jgi:hypothetical protein